LITALLSCNRQLALVGLQLRIINGVVSLLTIEVHNKALAAYLSEQGSASGSLFLSTATLEVLACVAFKQPISQAEIDQLFDADKRGLVVKLRDLKLVEEFAGADGRLRFATTRTFLQRFGLASLQELTAASLSDKATATLKVCRGGLWANRNYRERRLEIWNASLCSEVFVILRVAAPLGFSTTGFAGSTYCLAREVSFADALSAARAGHLAAPSICVRSSACCRQNSAFSGSSSRRMNAAISAIDAPLV
jgi:chromosome segregation and condensation protein ScpB